MSRVDALDKATGTTRYAADLGTLARDALLAGVKRSDIAHGRLLGVDVAAAARLPGVHAVLTGVQVPGSNRQGVVFKDMPVLADDKVRRVGDAVALVLAEDPDTLRRALAAIRVDIEPLPAVFDAEEALAPGAPLVHEEREQGNLLNRALIEKGDVDRAFQACASVVEATYDAPSQAHAFLETENGLALLDPDGTLTITASTQAPHRDRQEIAWALGLDPARVRVVAPYPGGAFGGKDGATVQCLLALAALHAGGRPVRMLWEREESFQAGYKRHAARLSYRLGALADGTLHALDCRLCYDTGAYAHLGAEVMALGLEHAGGPYRVPNVRCEGLCVYTNNPVAGAMRAFGVPQAAFGLEQTVDMLAQRLNIDPVALRQRNALLPGDENCAGVTQAEATGIAACLDRVAEDPAWRERADWVAAAPTFTRRGVGAAAIVHAVGYGRNVPDFAAARLELTSSGTFRLYAGVVDMGQGNASTYVQLAAEALNQPPERIELVLPDTAHTPYAGSSAASRTTYTFGNGLLRACADLRARLLRRAAVLLFLNEDETLELRPGSVLHVASGRELPLERLSAALTPAERICIGEYRAPTGGPALPTGQGLRLGFPHAVFSYGAHLACVEVDELTGCVRVVDYLAVTEAGRVLNPQLLEQQIEGAMAQGLGYALFEELVVEQGRIRTADLTTYLIPTSLDIPDIRSAFVETEDEHGPSGMKGAGEIAICGPLPAVANALAAAIGQRLHQAPLTPCRVLEALGRGIRTN